MYNVHWTHSLHYSDFIELTLTYYSCTTHALNFGARFLLI